MNLDDIIQEFDENNLPKFHISRQFIEHMPELYWWEKLCQFLRDNDPEMRITFDSPTTKFTISFVDREAYIDFVSEYPEFLQGTTNAS